MMRFVQIGVGVRGRQWSRVVREEPGAQMVGYVARRKEVLEAQVKAFGDEGVACFTDLAQALDETKPDALIIVTPPEGHHEQVMMAFERGIHALVEKPLTEDVPEAIDLVQQAERRGLQLMVGMNFRYLPSHQTIRRYILEETMGKPSFSQYTYLRHRDGRRHDLNKYCLTMEQPMLLEQSVHHLDLMRYCYAREVESVFCHTWNPEWSTYADDSNVSALMRFQGGLYATYVGTWTAGWNRLGFRWRIDFPGGVLQQDRQFNKLSEVRFQPELAMTGTNFKEEVAEPLTPVAMEQAEPFVDDTRGLLREFMAAVREGKPLITSGKDHLKTLSLVFACIESSKTGKEVFLADFYKRHGIPV
ncbi:MAG: Gfo/Idh/MocA family oxidoreductase [Chloroflexi bacterium]|nr:Gfo/Idh/MocA family oxidoreductase [Chloroflexota bacterium]